MMATLNDVKLTALETLTSNTGHVNDLELEWLQTVTSETTGTINDLWLKFLEDEGYTSGTLQDRQMEYWGDLMYTGTWNDRAIQFWAAGGPSGGADSLLTDLVAWWSLDQTSGTRVNAHNPGTYDLTDNNTVGYGTGKQGNCADFVSANSEYLSLANSAAIELGAGAYAFAMWVTRNNQFNNVSFLSKGDLRISNSGTGASSKARLIIPTSSGNEEVVSTGTIGTNGAWHFIVCQHDPDAGEIQISVNGSAFDSHTLAGTPTTNSSDLYFGIRGDLTVPHNGLIDEAAFWKGRILTDDDVAELYNSGAGMAYPG